jgi:hypothetical protein
MAGVSGRLQELSPVGHQTGIAEKSMKKQDRRSCVAVGHVPIITAVVTRVDYLRGKNKAYVVDSEQLLDEVRL